MRISSVKAIKLSIFLILTSAFLAVAVSSLQNRVAATPKDPVDEISAYRTWTKLTSEPIQGESLESLANLSVASAGTGG